MPSRGRFGRADPSPPPKPPSSASTSAADVATPEYILDTPQWDECHESDRSGDPIQRAELLAAAGRAGARGGRLSVGYVGTVLRRHDERLLGGQPRACASAHPGRAR